MSVGTERNQTVSTAPFRFSRINDVSLETPSLPDGSSSGFVGLSSSAVIVAELVMELVPGLPLLLRDVRGVVVAEEGEVIAVEVAAVGRNWGDVAGARLRGSTTIARREGVCEREAVVDVECREDGLEVRELLRKSSMGISSELRCCEREILKGLY